MKLERRDAGGMGTLVRAYIRTMNIAPALNRRRIFAAWDEATGAGENTIRRSFKDGKLYITLNSSVVRSLMYMQRDIYVKKINAILGQDELFSKDEPTVGYVKEIILK